MARRHHRLLTRFTRLALPLLPALQLLAAIPALASTLGAWRITPQGALELRTTPDVTPQAFFEAGGGLRGPRVWIDLPGAPSRSRTIPGSGSVKEVRIGRPDGQTTRLVVEFLPGTRLNPQSLRLVGTARDRWSGAPGRTPAPVPHRRHSPFGRWPAGGAARALPRGD